ncbi:MAG: endonuclease MutS2, partial [Candidatus Adiutrix sp.]
LDLQISPANPVVIISGLNTGGKTVAMKTLGLNLLLAKSGLLPYVGEKSHFDFLDLCVVMGDEQDLGTDLSTFSGHIKSVGRVLNQASPNLLVLLDEIGSGTDPAEGAALGLAVLENLYAKGALVMAATHYQLIKTWAALTPKVISVAVNASDFGLPLYGLNYGSPGFSGGLAMAKRLGLPRDLVERAESFLDHGQKRAMDLLAKLDEERLKVVILKKELEEEKMHLAQQNNQLRLQTEKQAVEFRQKAALQNKAISDALATVAREFELLKKEMRQSADASQHINVFSEKKRVLEKQLRHTRPAPPETDEEPLAFVQVGDEVMVKKLGRKAVVSAVNTERNEAWINAGGLNVKVLLSDLFALNPQETAKTQVTVTVTAAESHGLSINLLGHTVSEAISAIEKEIDQAILSGRKNIHIIHGFGTGKLRHGIRGFLNKHSRVKSFERAPQSAGGDGVTVVTLD